MLKNRSIRKPHSRLSSIIALLLARYGTIVKIRNQLVFCLCAPLLASLDMYCVETMSKRKNNNKIVVRNQTTKTYFVLINFFESPNRN